MGFRTYVGIPNGMTQLPKKNADICGQLILAVGIIRDNFGNSAVTISI